MISNTDFATVNSYQLTISKLPGVGFFCVKASLPGIRLPSLAQYSPYKPIPQAGSEMTLEPFSVDFYIDRMYNNYIAAMNWILALGRTDDTQYQNFLISNNVSSPLGEGLVDSSDGSLIVLTTNNNPALEIVYHNLIPVSLGTPYQATSVGTDVQYLQATMTFEYTDFTLNQLGGA